MKTIHPSSNRQISQQLPLVSIYWDYQNVKLSKEQVKSLLDFSQAKGCLIDKKLYYNSQCADQAAAKDVISLGFKCIDVPCPLKNSADNQLMVNCLEDLHSNQSPDIVILLSGDGDFVTLVSHLQKLDKQVINLAQKGNVKQKLKELADEFYFIDELFFLDEKKTQPQTTAVESRINNSEVIDYLIESIKIALSQGKFTEFGYIDKLMRQRCVKYQGFSSIINPDGKKFKSFSQFVDTAVKDGKVQIQNKQLFLIELDKIAA